MASNGVLLVDYDSMLLLKRTILSIECSVDNISAGIDSIGKQAVVNWEGRECEIFQENCLRIKDYCEQLRQRMEERASSIESVIGVMEQTETKNKTLTQKLDASKIF